MRYIPEVKYLEGLNDAQRQAVLATDGPISVLAGAGAGKTRVLTTRIYHLIREGVPPERILAVTFTNKAAREMRERVQKMLGFETSKNPAYAEASTGRQNTRTKSEVPFIATFHGLGRELLESYGSRLGVPRYFSVYDRDDSERAIAAALKSLDVGAKELSPRVVLSRISRAKGEGLTASEFRAAHARSSFAGRITTEVWGLYEKKLAEEKALDFDDLIAKPVRLLENFPDAREAAAARWEYLHIDEYQDTNALQERLVALLSEKHKNLFVVGDGDQAIYGWRGAKMENILEFEKRYPEAQTIVLEENYRSTENLVAAANSVIEKNKKRKEKRSTTRRGPGEPIRMHLAFSADDEARWIAERIKHVMAEGEMPEDIAVLFRTNFQSRALEEGFLRAGVPYRLLGTRYFERKEIKDVLAWLRLALEPSREADRVRAAGAPPRGLGRVTLAKLATLGKEGLRGAERAKVEAFEQVVAELSQAAETLAPSEFVKLIVEKSGMRRALFDEGNADDRERFENVEELASVAARHDGTPGKEGIAAFLAEAALASDQDEIDRPSTRSGQATEKKGVTLMTVHAAKGLEFGTVFVSGMEEGLFPHEDLGGSDRERDEEEERRLFYVAITRAKSRLYLTLARVRKIYGTDYLSEPSSFLADLAPGTVEYDNDNEEIIEA